MRLRDSRTGELVELEPGADGTIGIYACGPTVYGPIHVGNARPFVVFGLMKRYLEWRGRPVTLVENITDINDKIYTAATRAGVRSDDLAREMAAAYIADTERLGIGRPDHEPLASETLPEIVGLIGELVASEHAYEADGDVNFAVRSFPPYGELSGQRPDDLRAGARVEAGEHKRDPVDFALWKATTPAEDTAWPSPWGEGRPGWHIECSAMAEKILGRQFAVHGGGRDLIFPHHENEIAQSVAAGRPFASVWAHNGMLRLSGEKMSKSEGNIDLLADALDRWGAETIIMFLLQAHYASPVDYDDAALERARAACTTLRNKLRAGSGRDAGLRDAVIAALDDDFATPEALALLFTAPPEASDTVAEVLDVLGLGGLAHDAPPPADVLALAEQRRAARARRDFAESDRLRDELAGRGWEVRDAGEEFELYPHDG
jgi:cysteinyl-tRNA synthetase